LSFKNGIICNLKLPCNDSCILGNWCADDVRESCIGQRCDCSKSYWNGNECFFKKDESKPCQLKKDCLGDMICSSGSCQCSSTSTQYFDSTQLSCMNKTLKDTACMINMTCRSDLGLSCVNESCQCDSRTSYWSATRNICVDCPSGWTVYQDKCYFFYNNLSSWDNAQSVCQSEGGNLVSIRTQTDFDMVSSYYAQYTNYANLYVGARMNVTYDFYWRDGYTKMNQTYPNPNWWCSSMCFLI
jgi:hypothetical protein